MVSRPVVQSTGPAATTPGQALNAALTRLARDPRNLTALLDAGTAAMQLGDTDAAVGFFTRANEVAPGNGPAKAQIAMAMLKADQPVDAIRYFDEAERAGSDPLALAADRGLAYDLVGDNGAAQRYYQTALNRGANDEVLRRYALSLAIAGDRRAAEGVLAPLIQRRDRAAWRVRTFVMAISGSPEEAVSVAYASMPQDLAGGIAPYLRFMARLTPAQQAAAANLGRFPRAADIGRDDPRIVEYAALHPRAPRVDSNLIPAGEALGGKGKGSAPSRERRRRPGRDQQAVLAANTATAPAVRAAAAQAQPTRPTIAAPATIVSQPVVQPIPRASAPQVVSQPVVQAIPAQPQPQAQPPVRVAAASQVAPPPAPGFGMVSGAPSPAAPAPSSFDLARSTGAQAAPVVPTPYPLSRLDLPPGSPPPAASPIPVRPAGATLTAVQPAAAARPSVDLQPAASAPQPAPAQSPEAPPIVRTAEAQPSPAVTPPAAIPVDAAPDFRTLFDGFKAPEEERQPVVAAVDITRITPVRPRPPAPEPDVKATKIAGKGAVSDSRGERPDAPTAVSRTTEHDAKLALAGKEPAKGPKGTAKAAKDAKGGKGAKGGKVTTPSHPSRIWVQVLTGANKGVMDNEWRRMAKAAAVLKGRKPSITPWRSNFRLLTGPFESEAAAQDFVKALKKDGVASYQWTSPAGQAVDSLPLK